MPENKRQHYVPKSSLKHFACDKNKKQINIINIKRQKVIRSASLRDQCYRDYFYGQATEVEKSLSQLEGIFGVIVYKMIGSNTIDLRDAFHLSMMISLQKSRTLRAESHMNVMVDKIAKLMMYNRAEEDFLRKIYIHLENTANMMVGEALLMSPVILDLKQFLLVNKTSVPFILSDNPVVETNWFCRSRMPTRHPGGTGRSGVQILLPISPLHALLLHDNNVYTVDCPDNIMTIKRAETITELNELQWLNAHQNVYFPPELDDRQIQKILSVPHERETAPVLKRLEDAGKTGIYRMTDKDEYSPPSDGVTKELIHLHGIPLPKVIRIHSVRIRHKPHYHDNGSLASPIRDPAWLQIIRDFATAVQEQQVTFNELWEFVSRHPLSPEVGPWRARAYRRATSKPTP